MSALQLPLHHAEASVPTFEREAFYLGWVDAGKAPASRKASMAIGAFVGKYLIKPQACFCHPEDAAAIADWSLDVPVLAGPVPRHMYFAGPVPEVTQ